MDNVTTGGVIVALIGVLKGKEFWAFIKGLTTANQKVIKGVIEQENKLQEEIRSLYDAKIQMHTEQIDSMKLRMIRLEDEREEYKERMIKAESKVEALSERLTKYIHHSRGKKKTKKDVE